MASRYIKSSRTSSTSKSTDKLQDQFIRELTEQAQKILKDMRDQFSDELQKQSADFFQSTLGDGESKTGGGSFNNFSGLFSAASRLLVGKPKISKTSFISARSQEVDNRFKLSQAQSLAEAGITLSKGDKNL